MGNFKFRNSTNVILSLDQIAANYKDSSGALKPASTFKIAPNFTDAHAGNAEYITPESSGLWASHDLYSVAKDMYYSNSSAYRFVHHKAAPLLKSAEYNTNWQGHTLPFGMLVSISNRANSSFANIGWAWWDPGKGQTVVQTYNQDVGYHEHYLDSYGVFIFVVAGGGGGGGSENALIEGRRVGGGGGGGGGAIFAYIDTYQLYKDYGSMGNGTYFSFHPGGGGDGGDGKKGGPGGSSLVYIHRNGDESEYFGASPGQGGSYHNKNTDSGGEGGTGGSWYSLSNTAKKYAQLFFTGEGWGIKGGKGGNGNHAKSGDWGGSITATVLVTPFEGVLTFDSFWTGTEWWYLGQGGYPYGYGGGAGSAWGGAYKTGNPELYGFGVGGHGSSNGGKGEDGATGAIIVYNVVDPR